MKKFYLHVPEITTWHPVLTDMLVKMETGGLLDGVDEVNFCVNGTLSTVEMVLLPLLNVSDKFKMLHVNGDAAKWEWPTLNRIKQDADASDSNDYIGYGHLKGLTRPTDQKTIDWRNYLTYWGIERWKDSVDKLDEGFELVGVNWLDQPWPHLSGNTWWATSNYIRRLPLLQDPSKVEWGTKSKLLKPDVALDPGNIRYECEAWIGQGSPNVYEVHSSHGKADTSFHYNNLYPESNYR
jgi:hypothetical protein